MFVRECVCLKRRANRLGVTADMPVTWAALYVCGYVMLLLCTFGYAMLDTHGGEGSWLQRERERERERDGKGRK